VHNYPELLAAINDLDYELSATDVAALMDMLNYPNDRFPEKMRPIEINAVKNDVLDKLLQQKTLPEGLGLQIVEMAGNVENDPVWRDCCVQFSPVAWERIEAGAGNSGGAMASSTGNGAPLRKSYPQSTMRCSRHRKCFSPWLEFAMNLCCEKNLHFYMVSSGARFGVGSCRHAAAG
jgi:hypothetical protein